MIEKIEQRTETTATEPLRTQDKHPKQSKYYELLLRKCSKHCLGVYAQILTTDEDNRTNDVQKQLRPQRKRTNRGND